MTGSGVPQDQEASRTAYEKAAELGDPEAMNILG